MTIGHCSNAARRARASTTPAPPNSLVTNNKQALEYAPDYGLSNNISWAAQWVNEHAIANFENLAISGSEPADWAPGGEFHATTAQIESEDPDYILMTIGVNPLLSEMLFGIDHIAEMDRLLNREIEKVAAAVIPQRLQVVAPPHFDVGIDISPVYPSRFSCSSLGYKVDGPSVQSAPTQDELESCTRSPSAKARRSARPG